MSYTLRRMYKCNICGVEKISDIRYGKEELPTYNWCGSTEKNGICLCWDCSKAIKRVKLERYYSSET